jgi:hypothetical protein
MNKPKPNALVRIGLFVAGIVALGHFVGESPIDSAASDNATPSCKSDWHLCADNSDLMNNFHGVIHWGSACKWEAAKLAKYGEPKFPWAFPFATFHSGNDYVKDGKAILIEPDAQFQNGFGAMVHTRIECVYDIAGDKVVSVGIGEGHGGGGGGGF